MHCEILYSNENIPSTTTCNYMSKSHKQYWMRETKQWKESANVIDNHHELILGVLPTIPNLNFGEL